MSSTKQLITINSLPREILEHIFEERVELAHSQDGIGVWPYHRCRSGCILDWIPITHVCSRWRTIALEFQKLWTRIVLFHPEWTQLMLDRAGVAPLTVLVAHDDLLEKSDNMWMNDDFLADEDDLSSSQIDSSDDDSGSLDYDGDHSTANQNLPHQSSDKTKSMLHKLRENLNRVKDLSIQSPDTDNREGLTRPVRRWLERDDSGKLESLTLVLCGYWRGPLAHPQSIKRLSMKLSSPVVELDAEDEAHLLFEGMTALEELIIENTLMMSEDTLEGSKIHLPKLRYLHVDDEMYHCLEFLGALTQPRPFDYFGLKTGSCDIASDLPTLRDLVKLSAPGGGASISDLSGYHCALRVGIAEDAIPRGGTPFTLTAWRRESTNCSQVVEFARQGKVPPLPHNDFVDFTDEDEEDESEDGEHEDVKERMRNRNAMPLFRSTNPTLYLASDLRDEDNYGTDREIDGLQLLSNAFKLHTVVFASIDATLVDVTEISEDGMFTILQSMPSLRALELRAFSPSSFRFLKPRKILESKTVPAESLRELWIADTSFYPDDDYEVEHYDSEDEEASDVFVPKEETTLSGCLAARAALGNGLEKLVLKDCDYMQPQEWTALQAVTFTVEVIRSLSELD
ncbi:hypothetical protein CONPUDRAFT_162154 [Coniophora puteana RWD-64-598 SS2]|uniref:Uncharacterized protein n=1 Tax=Coniophora puteana (strain RWD-64-598) TaxID=741705 RepID=A0A5M3N0A0_CONPW|nr:uncharacterized protein CONPUDRAFT_162154 [Coniophora puteana RWD-64-598 SS2]EIW84830.1 hypothetical protein CONPUDRAFT_162154 [Coniophora puteana RWD-64-598 SS2]